SVRNLQTENGFEVRAHDTKADAAGNLFFTGRLDADLDFEGDTSLFVSSKSMFLARYGKDCPVYGDTTVSLCYGDSIEFGGQYFSGSGEYNALLQSTTGGDSILHISINELPAMVSGLPQDTTVCLNTALQLTAEAGYESYLWQDGSTGQSYSHTYTSEQTDTLTLTMGKTFSTPQGDMYCEWTDTIIVTADICNGYNMQQQASLEMYPNPASSSTELVFPATQNAKLLLYDSSGRLVKQTQISGNTHTLNLHNLEKGLYHIKLISKGYTLSEKLVVR
ncbi:MAG: T9SS type A sorting domain-containing protein, partial [Bacteroidales bacterium]